MDLKGLFHGDKKLMLLLAAGAAGILLIFLSGFWQGDKSAAVQPDAAKTAAERTGEDYEKRYQQRVEELVGCIAGAGEARVVVTLDSGVEYVYVKEESRSSDQSNGSGDAQSARSTIDQKTILVEDANGRKTALLRKTLEPTVRGVVVVCRGGDDPIVVERITEAVKTALGIPSTRVCVAPLSRESAE